MGRESLPRLPEAARIPRGGDELSATPLPRASGKLGSCLLVRVAGDCPTERRSGIDQKLSGIESTSHGALMQQQLAILEKALGPNNPGVATTAGNLAALYYRTGRYSDAEPLFKRVLAIMEETRGADHPDLPLAVRNLAQLYFNQGRYAEAEPLYKRSLGGTNASLWRY
jgi:tetratricopeptide (TPR) repeat protein